MECVLLQFFIIHDDRLVVCLRHTRASSHDTCVYPKRSLNALYVAHRMWLQMGLIQKVTLMKFDISIFIKEKLNASPFVSFIFELLGHKLKTKKNTGLTACTSGQAKRCTVQNERHNSKQMNTHWMRK